MLVDYVRSMIDLLLDYMHSANKTLEKAKQENEHEDESVASKGSSKTKFAYYENEIQLLEAEVRSHIRLEQQLKLHIDTVEARVEELEKENEIL